MTDPEMEPSFERRPARCVPYRQNIGHAGRDAVEKAIGEILAGGHADAPPLCNLRRTERKFSEAALDRG